MRIAFASSDGRNIDQHFGNAQQFYFFDIGPHFSTPYGKVVMGRANSPHDQKLMSRVNAVDGCTLVYSIQIGAPAAAKLVARRIQPIKAKAEQTIEEAIVELQAVLSQESPPPWLRLAAGLNAPVASYHCSSQELD